MRYTYVKQHDATDCAAACLAMVCLHYKKETTIKRLRDMMGTDLKGTNLLGLSKCAVSSQVKYTFFRHKVHTFISILNQLLICDARGDNCCLSC